MQIFKRNKGITLVALIITIIILLILAGVSISFLIGDNGVINKSQSAVNEYEEASKKEQDLLEQIDDYLEKELSVVDSNGLAKKDTTIVAKDDPSVQIVIPAGFAPAILMTGTTQSLPGENGAVKEIMPAEEWNNITKEDINRGIVVVDNTITYTDDVPDFNEYVWIPIPDSSKFARVPWTTPYGYNGDGKFVNGTGVKHVLADMSELNSYWEDNTTQEYKNMLSSIKENKGFYMSRYEASKGVSGKAQSKRNQNVWTDVSQIEATEFSKIKNNSHLIYGIEWDSMLNWILDSSATISSSISGQMKIIDIVDIQEDRRSWTNCKDAVGNAEINSGSLNMTGASEYWKANNIYDVGGSIREWTQEMWSTGSMRCL